MKIVFRNEGLVDIDAVTTFGINVKESSNPIGYFGTGFKYAVAVILRGGGSIDLWRGDQHLSFDAEPREVRGKNFHVVSLRDHSAGDARQLGFTTELGKNWEPWMAFRELYCNALDEGGAMFATDTTPKARANETMIVVDWPAFDLVFANRGSYFLDPLLKPVYSGVSIDVYEGESDIVFYRGIRVKKMNAERQMRLTYNIKTEIRLSEDRIMDDDPYYLLRNFWGYECSDKNLLMAALTAPPGFIEHELDYRPSWIHVSETFLDVVEALFKERKQNLNASAVDRLLLERKPADPPEKVLDQIDRLRLERAIGFCKRLGYEVDSYPILVTETLGPGVLAQADCKNQKIFLSQQLFNQGTKVVAQGLLEEFIHIKHGLPDESRALQTYLFETVVSLGERVLADAL